MKTQLKPCPTCGKMISENAQQCPHCGETLGSPIVRVLLLFAAVVLIILIAWMAFPTVMVLLR